MLKKYTEIHWGKTLLMLMPPLLRKQKQAIWLQVLSTPLQNLYRDTLYKMQHNGQVMYLEKVLNDLFNPGVKYVYSSSINDKINKGYIFIEDAFRPSAQYLYTHNEIVNNGDEPIIVANNGEILKDETRYKNFLYLSGASDFDSTEFFNFRIYIPSNLIVSYEKYKQVLLCLNKKLSDKEITVKEQSEQMQELAAMLIGKKDSSFSKHPDAIKITSPKFHKVVNYYKLAGKSYETHTYKHFKTQSLNTVRKDKEEKSFLKKHMYVK